MQTTTLPIQVSGANAQPPRPNAQASQGLEAGQFGATLAREMAQRQSAPQAPAQSAQKPAAPHKQQAADKPASADKASSREATQRSTAEADEGAATGEVAAEGQEAAEAAETLNPVADMLALVASFNQPAQPVDAHAAALGQAAAALAGSAGIDAARLAAAGKRAGQYAALLAAPDLSDPAAQDLALVTGQQAGDAAGGDPRTLQQNAGAQAGTQADFAQLTAQARDAAAAKVAAGLDTGPAAPVAQAPAAAAELAQTAAAAAGERLPARVGTPAWGNQLGQKIVWMVGQEQSATLTLNPPDLGPLQVVLSVDNDQASVAFSANQLEVRQALENALPRLREMMSESGIALGNATVDAGTPDQRQAQDGERRQGKGSGAHPDSGDVAENPPRSATRTTALGERGMVDTFA